MRKQKEEEFKKKIFGSEKGRKNSLEKYEEPLQRNKNRGNACYLVEDELKNQELYWLKVGGKEEKNIFD